MPKMGLGKISPSGVCSKWVKSRRRRRRKKKRKKVGENNDQLRFCLPPWVAHASRLDQKKERKTER